MNEKNPTMQSSDDGEEPIDASPEKMTYSKSQELISSDDIKPETQDQLNDSVKFEGINLEDDIEKVEVTSQDSLETDFRSPEVLINESLPMSIFPEIPEQNPTESIKNWLQRISESTNGAQKKNPTPTGTQPNRVVKYQDLPYMGEMTLDNSKPRRGRKPKKADICHLIYKNYGTIFPGTPNPRSYVEKEGNKKNIPDSSPECQQDNMNRSEVQNKIISSLLEKRLTQEHKRVNHSKHERNASTKKNQNEPLNLCIRDLNHLKIRLLKNNDNTYTSEIKSEIPSDDDVEIVQETPSPSSSGMRNELRFPSMTPDNVSTPSPDISSNPESGVPGGYVYWPTAGVFIHPMALQQHLMMYQRLTGGNSYTLPSHSPRPPPDVKPESSNELRKLVPKTVRPKKSESATSEETENFSTENKVKRNASTSGGDKSPAKRKRSAIFIPPIPAENNTNPATEVSICKFKFTGGAKPSLQEKKMLSVDSGGNFRYYSGTGDKSMRGYEFFPRETLQQQANNSQGSSTGAFLQASGEKIYPVPPIDITGSKNSADFMLSPEISSSNMSAVHDASARHKKRKSRKSLQREKLEQTFKEKGFLIQTQQLESAEGATYCKFRQLRKFTRYLFRSWKDYLPGNVRELQEGERPENESLEGLDNTNDSLSVNSNDVPSPPSSVVPLPL